LDWHRRAEPLGRQHPALTVDAPPVEWYASSPEPAR